jgi:hypothetical protein
LPVSVDARGATRSLKAMLSTLAEAAFAAWSAGTDSVGIDGLQVIELPLAVR